MSYLELCLTQHGIASCLAAYLTDGELTNVGMTCRTAYEIVLGPQRTRSLRQATKRCDGSVARRHYDNAIFKATAPPCQDAAGDHSVAKRCVRCCDRVVCNVCRFHVNRRPYSGNPNGGPPFQDEHDLEQQRNRGPTPYWHEISYGSWDREYFREPTEKLMANNWQVFCKEHLIRRRREFDQARQLGNMPKGLCRCNALERYVGNWICEPCFEQEKRESESTRWMYHCADGPRANAKQGDLSWRLCRWCKRLVWPHKPYMATTR